MIYIKKKMEGNSRQEQRVRHVFCSNLAKMKNVYAQGRIDAYNPLDFLRNFCDVVGNSKRDRSIDLSSLNYCKGKILFNG